MSEKAERVLQQIEQRIQQAALKAGRAADAVRLVGASKQVAPETLRDFWDAGLRCFGENRAQELKAKALLLPENCEWHFIGGLQTNKVGDVVKLAALIHSVDRVELIEEIEKKATNFGKTQRVLIEVNVGGEASKHGVLPSETHRLVEAANAAPHVEVVGFMAVPPFCEDAEKARPFFATLRKLRDKIQQQSGCLLPELSMGMSHDFEAAIEEGATMVRIGTALFGARGSR
ncbi:MAG: YggS family pyridoxal phosphate-dependent enzyme [bacterium]